MLRVMWENESRNGIHRVWLVSGNETYPPNELLEGHELLAWGIAALVMHKCG